MAMRFIAAAIGAVVFCSAAPAKADDWGCEVLLCLSNPSGPTAVVQCVQPITKLWRHLALGRAFPTCTMNNSSGHFARNDTASGSNCPPGYTYRNSDNDLVCRMQGVVTVMMNGTVQRRTWWGEEGTLEESVPQQAAGPLLDRSDGRDGGGQ